MEKFDPIDIEFLINSEEVKADAKRVKDDIRGIGATAEAAAAKVNGVGDKGGIASPLKAAGNAAEASGKKAAAARPMWNGLGNSINQMTREIPAFTYSAQTGFMALSNNIPILADEIGRLKTQNDALVASGGKGVPVWKQVVKGLLSWQTALAVGVALLTIYGHEMVKYVSNLFKGKEALDAHKKSVDALNAAYESSDYQKVIKDLIELRSLINLAKDGLIDKKVALDKYNDSMGKVYETTDDLNEAERVMIEKAPAYIESMLYKAAATYATADAAKALAENMQKQFEKAEEIEKKKTVYSAAKKEDISPASGPMGPYTPNYGASIASRQTQLLENELTELEKTAKKGQEKSAKIVDDLNKKAAEIAKAAGLKNIFGNPDPDPNPDPGPKVLNDRKNLLEKIADLDREYAKKQLDRDEEELQALRDKFTKVRELVEQFNQDPKNYNKKIDLTDLGVLQENAEAGLTYRQDTRNLQTELEKQKKLYREIEEYKATFGIEKTRERYGKELEAFENYSQLLKSQIKENQAAFDAVDGGTATAAQKQRVALLKEEAAGERAAANEKYTKLLADLMSFEEERRLIVEKYKAKRDELVANGDFAEMEELDRRQQEALDKMDAKYAKGTEEYKALIRGVEGLSETAARAVIANARKMVEALVAAGRLSADAASAIMEKINGLEATLDSGPSDKLAKIAEQTREIGNAFLELGDAVGYFDAGLGDSLSTLGELANVASDAAMAVVNFSSGNIIGGITSAISAVSGIFRIGAKARESERKAKAELLKINREIEDGERRINEILRERNIERAQEVELTLKGIKAQREALALARSQNGVDRSSLLKELQGEDFISGSRTEKYGGFLGIGRKTRVVNEYSSMLGMTFEEIEKLFEKGQLDERAAELFEQLRKLQEEGKDINGMLKDLEKQANEVFTATTSNAIADSIIEGLRQGHDSFEDFAGGVESMLQGAILNAIKFQMLEEPLKKLYEQFSQYAESEGQLTNAEAEAIRAQYQRITEKAIDQYDQWSQVLDEDLIDGQATEKGLQGAIRREMTEETASELTGLFRGQYDITKRHFQLHEMHFELERRHFDATMRIMQYSALIEQNTLNTVVQLQYAVTELKSISTNTKPSQTARDLGK